MIPPYSSRHCQTRSMNASRPSASRLVPSRSQQLLDLRLRGDPGVVGAERPLGAPAEHAVVADQAVLDRAVERVAHVQRAGHVRRRDRDREVLGRRALRRRVEQAGLEPAREDARLGLGGLPAGAVLQVCHRPGESRRGPAARLARVPASRGPCSDRLLPVLRGVRPARAGRPGAAGPGGRPRPAVDLRPLPPVERRAGPEPVRVVGDRRARRRGPGHARDHRGHLPDRPDPPGDHRPGGRHVGRPARGPLRARRRQRRGAQRAHPRRRAGPRPTCGWRCSRRRSRSCAGSGRAAQFSHDGAHYVVENARIYTLPESRRDGARLRLRARRRSSSPRASATATAPSGPTRSGGAVPRRGGGDGLVQGGHEGLLRPGRGGVRQDGPPARGRTRGCPASSPRSCPTPAHFEQAAELVTEEMIAESVPCGPDVDRIAETRPGVRRRRLRRALRRSRSATARPSSSRCSRRSCCRDSGSPAGCRTRSQIAGPDAPRRNHLACWSSSRRSNGTQTCRSRYGASSRTVLKPAAVTIPAAPA